MIKFKKTKFIFSLISLLIIFMPGLVQAQTVTGLRISPAFVEDKAVLGETVSQTVKLTNNSKSDRSLVLEFKDIVGFFDNGQPIFTDETLAHKTDMSSWVSLPVQSVNLSAQSSVDVSFGISLPVDAALGRHQGGLFIRDLKGGDYETGIIVSLFIQGDFDEDLQVSYFTTPSFLYSQAKVDFSLQLENDGNSILRPQGNVVISNLFGQEVARFGINDQGMTLFPGENKEFNLSWVGAGYDWGRFQAVYSTVYGQSNQLLTTATSFWVLPLNVILIIFILIIILIAVLVLSMRWLIRRKALEYYRREALAQGREYIKDDVPEIVLEKSLNLKRLLLVTIVLLVMILSLLAALYFV